MEARAIYDFRASQPDELTFKQGDVLKILQNQRDEQWYRAEHNGVTGFVPKNRLELRHVPWYLGVISRIEAENRLRNASYPDGAFLVRDSESTPGDFSLSVKMNGGVDHYRVLRDTCFYYLWEVRFNSLNELVGYHMEHSISRTSNLLLVNINLNQSYQPPHQQPPQPAPQGGPVPTFQARAAYTFKGEENNELSFDQGETIVVHVNLPTTNSFNLNSNWWYGEVNRRGRVAEGLFPSTYVVVPQPIRHQYQIQAETAGM